MELARLNGMNDSELLTCGCRLPLFLIRTWPRPRVAVTDAASGCPCPALSCPGRNDMLAHGSGPGQGQAGASLPSQVAGFVSFAPLNHASWAAALCCIADVRLKTRGFTPWPREVSAVTAVAIGRHRRQPHLLEFLPSIHGTTRLNSLLKSIPLAASWTHCSRHSMLPRVLQELKIATQFHITASTCY